MMDDIIIKNKIQEFKDGYSVSYEDDGKRKHEIYTIQSPELKAVLRKIALTSENAFEGFGDFFSRKAEIGNRDGNFSSYEENVDGYSDRFVMIRFYNDNHKKEKFKAKQSEKEETDLVPLNKKKNNQVAGWRSEETEAERCRREAEQWKREAREAGFPIDLPYEQRVKEVERRREEAKRQGSSMGDYTSVSVRQGNQIKEERFLSNDDPQGKITEIVDNQSQQKKVSYFESESQKFNNQKSEDSVKGVISLLIVGSIAFLGVVGFFVVKKKS